jgi:hypothetical protein
MNSAIPQFIMKHAFQVRFHRFQIVFEIQIPSYQSASYSRQLLCLLLLLILPSTPSSCLVSNEQHKVDKSGAAWLVSPMKLRKDRIGAEKGAGLTVTTVWSSQSWSSMILVQ